MAYAGWLIKVGSYTIPFKYMQHDSYSVTRNTQDLDAYNDANGELHRNVVDYIVDKVVFETPYLYNDDKTTLFSNIQSQYTNSKEHKASVTVYVPEYDCYTTQDMYLANPEIAIYHADENDILYEPIRFAFIGYGVIV